MSFHKIILIISTLLAICAPFLFDELETTKFGSSQFPGWPSKYEGRLLTKLELTEREALFVKDFPGKIGRFSDGYRELIIRWIEQPTRKLHPAADCFKGIGYYIKPLPLQVNESGIKMGCFTANNDANSLNVCEYIQADDGQNWSDISAWYWNAIFADSSKGWMSYVIAEKINHT